MNALANLNRLHAFGSMAGDDWEVLAMNANSPTEDRSVLGNLKLKKALLCLKNDSYVEGSYLTGENPTCEIKFLGQTIVNIPETHLNISLYLREVDLIWDDEVNLASVSLPPDEDFVMVREAISLTHEQIVSEIRRNTTTREVVLTERNTHSEKIEEIKSVEELHRIISSKQFELIPFSVQIRRVNKTADLPK